MKETRQKAVSLIGRIISSSLLLSLNLFFGGTVAAAVAIALTVAVTAAAAELSLFDKVIHSCSDACHCCQSTYNYSDGLQCFFHGMLLLVAKYPQRCVQGSVM